MFIKTNMRKNRCGQWVSIKQGFSKKYGYGKIDAEKAVKKALELKTEIRLGLM